MTRPHIVIYAAIHADHGGIEHSILQLMTHLGGSYRYSLICNASPDYQARIQSAGAAWYPLAEGVPSAFSPSAIRALAHRLKHDLQADLVQTSEPRGSTIAIPAARLAGVPALHWHKMSPLSYEGASRPQKIAYAWGEALLNWWGVGANAFVSERMRRGYIRWGLVPPWKAHYAPNGIDLAEFEALRPQRAALRAEFGISDGDFLWVNIGRLAPQKAQDVILAAAARLSDEWPWQIRIIGGGELAEALRMQIDAAGLAERVHLLGRLPTDQARAWLAAADGFLLPSRYENMPWTLLEAMALGVPCIVTDVGDSWFMVGEGDSPAAGVCVPREDAPALARAMHALMQDSVLRAGFRRGGLARIPRFTRQAMLDRLDRLYERVLS